MQTSAKADRDTVVFMVAPGLGYTGRMVLGLGLAGIGLALQAWTLVYLPGIVLVLAGNLLLLVKGYDNRVKLGAFEADAAWTRVEAAKLAEVEALHKRMITWDRSALDITNGLGFFVLLLVVGAVIALEVMWENTGERAYALLAANAVVLLAPHWVCGVRRILTAPALISKIRFFGEVLDTCAADLKEWKIEYYMQLGGAGTKVPRDMKLRLMLPGQPETLLGVYGQISTNTVNGTSYPYFYTVLVARKGSGLQDRYGAYDPPAGMTKEYSVEGEVEVLVVRQTTTKTSGYHTTAEVGARIMREGLALGRQAAGAGTA